MTATPVLILPGYADSGPDHWQSHWERADSACRRVVQDDWLQPRLHDWLAALDRHVRQCVTPPVLAAHSLACSLVAHWATRPGARARGALLVAPADVDSPEHTPDEVRSFSPIPLVRLPFPSIVVTSTDDPFAAPGRAAVFADAWGSRLVTLQGAGHINADAGFGPWPEGATAPRRARGVSLAVPPPRETFDLVMGDGAIVRVRCHGRAEGTRLYVSHGNGFAVDGYYPFWGPLTERFDVIAFDVRSHGQNPRAASGRDGHTYAQMTLDLTHVMRGVTARLGPRPCVGVFHSMSARAAMKHAIELGFPWEALILFDPPNVPPPGHACYEAMDAFERRLADWALARAERFADPAELARQYADTRAHRSWVTGSHALMAEAVLHRADDGAGWVLACPRELEASIYLQAMTLNLWPPAAAYGGPVKLIGADPAAPGAPAPAFANRALAEEGGYAYEAIPGTGHLLQVQEPEECRRSMLAFLDETGVRY